MTIYSIQTHLARVEEAVRLPGDHGHSLDRRQARDLVLESLEEDWQTVVELGAEIVAAVGDDLAPGDETPQRHTVRNTHTPLPLHTTGCYLM